MTQGEQAAPRGEGGATTPESDPGSGAWPRVVVIACWAMVISYATGIAWRLSFYAGLFGITRLELLILLICLAIGISVMAWIIRSAWIGRNWSRNAWAVVFVLQLIAEYRFFQLTRLFSPFERMLYLVNLFSSVVVIALLFAPSAHSWFVSSRTLDYRSRKRLTPTSGLGE